MKAGVGAGQTAGPALTVTITIHNGSGSKINLDSAVVTLLVGSAKTPGEPVDVSPTVPLAGDLAAGGTASGVYAFRVNDMRPGALAVTVSYSPVEPPLTFSGTRA